MTQGNESNRQRDEGKEESSYEHNRANFYFLHSTEGDNKRWNMETNFFWGGDVGRLTMFDTGLFYNLE